MNRLLVVAATCVSVGLPTYAFAQQTETGGPSGGPNQAQSVTGGPSGGPNQAQAVDKPMSKKKKHHHHHHHHHKM